MILPPLDRWGVTGELRPLTGGHRNRILRLGDRVFKSTRRSHEAIDWLGPVQDLARQAGFVVPELRPGRDGRLVQAGWTCEDHVVGEAVATVDLAGLLPAIQRFHALAVGLPQRLGFLSSQDLLTARAGGDVDLAAMPADLVARCRAACRGVAGGDQTIVHGDLSPGNLLRRPDGRIALIDWDECRRDLALFDLALTRPASAAEQAAMLAWEVACCWQIEPDRARQLVAQL